MDPEEKTRTQITRITDKKGYIPTMLTEIIKDYKGIL